MSKLTKKMGGVTLATLGLSTCINNGAVDPAPPPLVCSDVAKGEPLTASVIRAGDDLRIRINVGDIFAGAWVDRPAITDLMGVTAKDVVLSMSKEDVNVTLTLDAPTQKTAAFTLKGEVMGYANPKCPVERRFTLDINGGVVKIAQAGRALPLSVRDRVTIALAGRDGRAVELRAAGAGAGARLDWTATAGTVEASAGGGVRWILPDEPGLYQIELLVDRGEEGVVLDALTLEVT